MCKTHHYKLYMCCWTKQKRLFWTKCITFNVLWHNSQEMRSWKEDIVEDIASTTSDSLTDKKIIWWLTRHSTTLIKVSCSKKSWNDMIVMITNYTHAQLYNAWKQIHHRCVRPQLCCSSWTKYLCKEWHFSVSFLFVLLGRRKQTQRNHDIDACTPCTLFQTRHTWLLLHSTCQMNPGVRFSATDVASLVAPTYSTQPEAARPLTHYNTCLRGSRYKTGIGRHKKRTKHVFIGLSGDLQTSINWTQRLLDFTELFLEAERQRSAARDCILDYTQKNRKTVSRSPSLRRVSCYIINQSHYIPGRDKHTAPIPST